MYKSYEHLRVDVDASGVAIVTITENQSSVRQHYELSRIWNDLRDDEAVRVVITTGVGESYLAGPTMDAIEHMVSTPSALQQTHVEARDIVHNMINFDKPVIAAVNGTAIGHGLGVALMSDITIVAEDATLMDGHSMIGVPAGDNATLIWPLLVGMGKTKYYLLTGEVLDGKEAEKIGLMNESLPAGDVLARAKELAARIAAGPQLATQATKRALNQWLRLGAHTSFDYSLALEMLAFQGEEFKSRFYAAKELGLTAKTALEEQVVEQHSN